MSENTLINSKLAVLHIDSEWDIYEECKAQAIASGGYHLSTRKLFYKATGIQLPYLCMWDTREDMREQLTGKI